MKAETKPTETKPAETKPTETEVTEAPKTGDDFPVYLILMLLCSIITY